MRLEGIRIMNFRNITDEKLDFSSGINCVVGPNGSGKSNLLEAVYLLATSRSTTSNPDAFLIRHGEEGMSLRGEFNSGSRKWAIAPETCMLAAEANDGRISGYPEKKQTEGSWVEDRTAEAHGIKGGEGEEGIARLQGRDGGTTEPHGINGEEGEEETGENRMQTGEGEGAGRRTEVRCGVVRGKGKKVSVDGKDVQRLSEYYGRFPAVYVAPADVNLVYEGAEVRRKLMDMVISQTDQGYLQELIRYNKCLESRNKMLKAGIKDSLLYESVEKMMDESARTIYGKRKSWSEEINAIFGDFYKRISGGSEAAAISYESQLSKAGMPELFESRRSYDSLVGHTTVGIHRDNLVMTLDGYQAKAVGSQGQVKTIAIALKLAIFHQLRRQEGKSPLLLMDDIFDKLDSTRVSHIMEIVGEDDQFGQIFITDTDAERLHRVVSGLGCEKKIYRAEGGRFEQL